LYPELPVGVMDKIHQNLIFVELLEVYLQSMSRNLAFHVIDKPVTPLLGITDSLSLSLIQLNSEFHEVDTTDALRAAILDRYKDLFQGDLGNLPVVYKMRFDANVTL